MITLIFVFVFFIFVELDSVQLESEKDSQQLALSLALNICNERDGVLKQNDDSWAVYLDSLARKTLIYTANRIDSIQTIEYIHSGLLSYALSLVIINFHSLKCIRSCKNKTFLTMDRLKRKKKVLRSQSSGWLVSMQSYTSYSIKITFLLLFVLEYYLLYHWIFWIMEFEIRTTTNGNVFVSVRFHYVSNLCWTFFFPSFGRINSKSIWLLITTSLGFFLFIFFKIKTILNGFKGK